MTEKEKCCQNEPAGDPGNDRNRRARRGFVAVCDFWHGTRCVSGSFPFVRYRSYGKSTLLRALPGLVRGRRDVFWFRGMTSRICPRGRALWLVFQSYASWPHMTVRERGRSEQRKNKRMTRVGAGYGRSLKSRASGAVLWWPAATHCLAGPSSLSRKSCCWMSLYPIWTLICAFRACVGRRELSNSSTHQAASWSWEDWLLHVDVVAACLLDPHFRNLVINLHQIIRKSITCNFVRK